MNILLKHDSAQQPQAGLVALNELKKPWVERFMVYEGRTIPVVSTALKVGDRWEALTRVGRSTGCTISSYPVSTP